MVPGLKYLEQGAVWQGSQVKNRFSRIDRSNQHKAQNIFENNQEKQTRKICMGMVMLMGRMMKTLIKKEIHNMLELSMIHRNN